MKTMIAKYAGTCCECGKAIAKQTPIKFFGRGRAAHVNCFNPKGKSEMQIASEQRAPCWICKAEGGRFRNLGAASPVWCDGCFAKETGKGGRRDNSSAEDSCCGDLAYEDRCRDACELLS